MYVSPKFSSTLTGSTPWEWIPLNFDYFLEELDGIKDYAEESGHLLLYRGQSDINWLLDSTFVRFCKEHVFGINQCAKLREDFRLSIEHQQIVGNLLLFKFGFATVPSKELFECERLYGIDPWFEWLKRLQQYGEDDKLHLKGTFIMDWTDKAEVAVYFSNYCRRGDGGVWICDATVTGRTLQLITVAEILGKMKEGILNNRGLGIPLMFYPRKQIASERASNQGAIYFAQMDLRFDLSEIWSVYEKERNNKEKVFIKLVLPITVSNDECTKWLVDRGITRNYLFPDETRDLKRG
ncbi:MAG: hypothetical protein ABSA46_10310 [Thermodesulfovibrionales bacterium]|jgi:hypothetical protein